MAGRIRTIKPELLANRRTASLSSDAFRLFIGCILEADDYGNFYAEPGRLCGVVFWACPPLVPISDVLAELTRESRDSLARLPLLSVYTVGGEKYGHINGWDEHQRVDKPGKPRVPGPERADTKEIKLLEIPRETLATVSREPRESLAPDHRSPITDHHTTDPPDEPTGAPPGSPSTPALELHSPVPAVDPVPRALLAKLAEASGGRFVEPRQISHKSTVRSLAALAKRYPSAETWELIGEWLKAGHEDWKDTFDITWIIKGEHFNAWEAKAVAWDKKGRAPLAGSRQSKRPIRPISEDC